MWVMNEKEPFESDREYAARMKKEPEYVWADIDYA
jgi:hypothetical protein